MLNIKTLVVKNFLSFGNDEQVIELNGVDIALVLGLNLDASGGDNTTRRNGVGKSTIIQALIYGLFGTSIDNKIKVTNLVNKTNEKHCVVSVIFEKDGIEYKVTRGRSPTTFEFYTTDNMEDNARGVNKFTQEDLDRVLGISRTLAEHILTLNTTVTPFLDLPTTKQREIIEELVGISELTAMAVNLKQKLDDTKKKLSNEEVRVGTITDTNKTIQINIDQLKEKSELFDKTRQAKIDKLKNDLKEYDGLDLDDLMSQAIEREKREKHNEMVTSELSQLAKVKSDYEKFEDRESVKKQKAHDEINELSKIDVDAELQIHNELKKYNETLTNNQSVKLDLAKVQSAITTIKTKLERNVSDIERNVSDISKEEKELNSLESNHCPVCNSVLDDDEHLITLKNKHIDKIARLNDEINNLRDNIDKLNEELSSLEGKGKEISGDLVELGIKPVPQFKSESEVALIKQRIELLQKEIDTPVDNPYTDDMNERTKRCESLELLSTEGMLFSVSDVNTLSFQLKTLQSDLDREEKSDNPYTEQIETMKGTLVVVDYSVLNDLEKLMQHQDVLHKLLSNKDSYIRKYIIEQNIAYLNARLAFYNKKIGSLHDVVFKNDLTIDINLRGNSYDFSQLSRGERTRVIISLNLAFRDKYEASFQNINLLMIDELLDNGLDSGGITDAWYILNNLATFKDKNVFVVSHREELTAKSQNVLQVTRENGFSSIELLNSDDL